VNKRFAAFAALLIGVGHAAAVTDCRISSSAGMAFGSYDVLSAFPDDSVATVVASCTRNGGPQNVTITLQLSQGANGTSVTARQMINTGPAGGFLAYGLFRDVARSSVWGFSPGVDAHSQVLAIPNNQTRMATFTIYGRIPAQQDVAVGMYNDQVTATIAP
jgi:spore coat protein U-like protein